MTIAEKIKKEIKTFKDIAVSYECFKLLKTFCELNTQFSILENIEVIPSIFIKID